MGMVTATCGHGTSEELWVGTSGSSNLDILSLSGSTSKTECDVELGSVTAVVRSGTVVWSGHADGVCVEWCTKVHAAIRFVQAGQGAVLCMTISEHPSSATSMLWAAVHKPDGEPSGSHMAIYAVTPDDNVIITKGAEASDKASSRCRCVLL